MDRKTHKKTQNPHLCTKSTHMNTKKIFSQHNFDFSLWEFLYNEVNCNESKFLMNISIIVNSRNFFLLEKLLMKYQECSQQAERLHSRVSVRGSHSNEWRLSTITPQKVSLHAIMFQRMMEGWVKCVCINKLWL